jgi:hypothetical protein
VSFFPEGGSLPAGVPVRIAFKALGEDGLGLPVTGKIVNSDGEEVAEFSSNRLGMGSFVVSTKLGEKYIARCKNSQGVEKQFELPEAKAGIMNLKAIVEADSVIIEALRSTSVDNEKASGSADMVVVGTIISEIAPPADSLHLLIQCRGNIYFNELMAVGGKFSIAKEALPSGVIQLLLLNRQLKPLSERLIFNLKGKDTAHVSVTASKESYQKREQIDLSVKLNTHDGVPIQDGFSISVSTDPDLSVSILSTLLLTSELKGYVEQPASYFSGDMPVEEIDHLLLTQGWSRYNITAVLEGYNKKPKQFPEITPEISGQISSRVISSKKTTQYVKINAAGIYNQHLPGNVTEVVDRNFDISYNDYPNGTTYTLQTGPNSYSIQPKLSGFYGIKMNFPYSLNRTQPAITEFLNSTAETISPYKADWQQYYNEVLSSGDREAGISPLSPGRRQDKIFNSLVLWKNKKMTVSQFLSSVDNVTIKNDENGMAHLRYSKGGLYYDYVVIVDDRWMNVNACSLHNADFNDNGEYRLGDLLSLPVDRIEEIEILQAPAPPVALKSFGNLVVNDPVLYRMNESLSPISTISPREPFDISHPGNMGTILITTTDRNAGINKALPIAPLGYQISRDFFSPAYKATYPQTPDMRTTLYWNPDVQTGDDGKAVISFFASDRYANYTITIEGITKEGILIRKTEKIKKEILIN